MSARTSSRGRGTEPRLLGRQGLAARRKRARRRLAVALAVLALLLCGAIVWGLWQPLVRINTVRVSGGDLSLANFATEALAGSYFHIVPRNSTFFPPERAIRTAILASHPEIAAVSIYHSGLRALTIDVDMRTPVARWCGLSYTPHVAEYCYVFDPSGFIFGALPEPLGVASSSMGTSTEVATTSALVSASPVHTLNPFVLYAPLAESTEEPLRATIAYADTLPSVFDFARQLSTFGSPVSRVTLDTEGEVEDVLASGTQVRYVRGQEQDAFTALTSAREQFNLADGSVEYVDLRFPGKVYVKRVGEEEAP